MVGYLLLKQPQLYLLIFPAIVFDLMFAFSFAVLHAVSWHNFYVCLPLGMIFVFLTGWFRFCCHFCYVDPSSCILASKLCYWHVISVFTFIFAAIAVRTQGLLRKGNEWPPAETLAPFPCTLQAVLTISLLKAYYTLPHQKNATFAPCTLQQHAPACSTHLFPAPTNAQASAPWSRT